MTPEQRAGFIANVPDAEQRREAERLWQASLDTEALFLRACIQRGVGVTDREQRQALVEAALASDPDLKALHDTAELAYAEWNACDYGVPFEAESGEIVRCGLTGFLIHDGDPFLIDPRTNECVLKAALGVPTGYIVGEFRSADGPSVVFGDDALSAGEAVI